MVFDTLNQVRLDRITAIGAWWCNLGAICSGVKLWRSPETLTGCAGDRNEEAEGVRCNFSALSTAQILHSGGMDTDYVTIEGFP